jgi:methanogenic corrinoid protein MtbC1
VLDLILSKKIKKEIIYGDNEKAILMINAILKSDIDIVFLIDKYFGNVPAVLGLSCKRKIIYYKPV